MHYSAININEKLKKFSDVWSPKIIAKMNNYHFKLVKIKGDFIWHKHNETDEVFIVIEGEMKIEFKDGLVKIKKGEMFVVPKCTEHRTFSDHECNIMLVEPVGTINTGDAINGFTAVDNVWV
jgi:mannose-6-phosphate isomerase-like protein (cupin superfamily)